MKNKKNTIQKVFVSIISASILYFGPAQAEQPSDNNDWEFNASIYLWASDLNIGTNSGTPDLDIPFSTIIDNLDVGFMGSFEARKGKWLLLTDVVYLDISDDQTNNTPSYKLDLEGWVLHVAGGYNLLSNKQSRLDFIAGVRNFDMRIDASITQGTYSLYSEGYMTDAIIGVKGQQTLNNNWYIPYYFDIGGGGSDMTWQAMAGISYQAANWVDVSLLYRHIYWDLGSSSNTFNGKVENITFSGPVFGAIFRF